MSSDFELALRELEDEDNPLTYGLLSSLSGPTHAERDIFVASFGRLSDPRRREIILRMVECAEESFQLDYADLFRHCLGDSDPMVRRCAIEGLWEEDRVDLMQRLLKMLDNDPDIEVRAAAASSLGRFVYLVEWDEIDQKHGATLRESLERVIRDPNEDIEVVRRAVEAIAHINDDDVRRIIDRAYAYEDDRMRVSAVFGMGRSADPFWAETVLAELYAPSPEMRFEAARACGEIQLRRAVPRLSQLIEDRDREVQDMAIWALGQIGGKRARAILEQCVASDDQVISAAAEAALGEIEFADGMLSMMEYELDDRGLVEMDTLLEGTTSSESGASPPGEFTSTHIQGDEFDHSREDREADSEEWPDEFIELG